MALLNPCMKFEKCFAWNPKLEAGIFLAIQKPVRVYHYNVQKNSIFIFFRREECVQLRTVLANVSLSDNEHLSSFSKTGTFWDFLTGTGYFIGDQRIDVSAEVRVGSFSSRTSFNSCLQLIHWRVFKIYTKSDPMGSIQ